MEAVALAPTSADKADDQAFISIGIDFGTTFSCAAWALSTSPDDISIVGAWEVETKFKADSHKVPSVLTYNSKAEVASWGFSLHQNGVAIKYFKLLLSEHATKALAKRLPNEHKILLAELKKLQKEPSDVVGDYLRCLWHHVVGNIKENIGHLLWENLNLKIILTIPTIWDLKANTMLRRSAEKAGLLERTGTSLELVAESEAAAIEVLRLQQWGNVKLGDTFIVCDAGAVEVALNSYRIENLRPLRLMECSPPTGGLCGSSFLDVAFEKQIRSMISNEEFDKLSHRSKREMMDDWERGVKRTFHSGSKNNTWHIEIPGFQGVRKRADHSLDDLDEIDSGTLELRTDHLEAIFSDVCSQIIDLVNAQRGGIRRYMGKEPDSLFLVGGFGENRYLRELLQLSLGKHSIRVQSPARNWTAACHGAVLKSLGNDIFINHVSGGRVDMVNSKETITSVGTSYAPSIFSVESMDSSWSHLSEEEFQSAAAELVSLLLNDEHFKPLYLTALESPKIGGQRFETNFRRLLKKFAVDLKKEAKDPLQVRAAKFVGAQAYLVAGNIREALQTHEDRKVRPILAEQALPLQDTDHETSLAENPSAVTEEEQQSMLDLSIRKWISKTDTSSYPEASEVPDTDDAHLSSLVEVKQFILSSNAFVALRHNFTNFVYPPIEPASEEAGQDTMPEEKTKHESMPSHPEQKDQPKEVHTDSFDLEPFQLYYNGRMFTLRPWNLVPSIGFIDQAKAVMERFIHCRIIWWPFTPRNTDCLKDHVRVTWYCDCGTLLYFDTPTHLARKLISHCMPLDRAMSGSLLPVHHGPSQSSSVSPDQGHPNTHNRGPQTRTNQDATADTGDINLQLSPQVNITSNLSSTYLHWCVDSTPSDTLLFSLEIPRIDDTNIIKRLKHCYKSVKGWRRWISLTDCEDVKFVLFKRGVQRRAEDLIVCLKEDLPAKTDPNYMYLDTEPPELLKDFAAQTLKHHLINPHKCSSKDIEEIMLLVPKKVNGLLEKKFGIVGWGVLAVPGLAIWKCLIALALSQTPPVIFAIRWLLGHPGDLQNAFLLSFYILGALNVVLIIPEKWSLRRARF